MPDYNKSSSNVPKDDDEEESPEKPKKKLDKVVEGEVIVKKSGIGRKAKDIIAGIALKDIAKGVFKEFIVPMSAKVAVEAWSETGNRIFMPNTPRRPFIDARSVQRQLFNYNGISSSGNPISRQVQSIPLGHPAPPREVGPRGSAISQHASFDGEQYLFPSKEDAVRVIDQLRDALDMYQEPVTLNDFYDSCGRKDLFSPVNEAWGWRDLSRVKVLQTREGYILDFPRAEAL